MGAPERLMISCRVPRLARRGRREIDASSPLSALYCAVTARRTLSTRSCGTSATTQPPNPPPSCAYATGIANRALDDTYQRIDRRHGNFEIVAHGCVRVGHQLSDLGEITGI